MISEESLEYSNNINKKVELGKKVTSPHAAQNIIIKKKIYLDEELIDKEKILSQKKSFVENSVLNLNNQIKNNNNYYKNQYQELYMNAKPKNIFPFIDNSSIENKSDILLKKNYFNFNEKLQNESGFYTKSKPRINNIENYKLMTMINFLTQESQNKTKIIESQQKEINTLKRRVNTLEKKWNYLFK
jgi:hypothetical protein